jgi:hypothetical protein
MSCFSPGAWYQVLGTRHLVPDTWHQAPGAWYQAPGTWYQVPATRCQVPGTWYQASGTGCLVQYLIPGTTYKAQVLATKFPEIPNRYNILNTCRTNCLPKVGLSDLEIVAWPHRSMGPGHRYTSSSLTLVFNTLISYGKT